MSVKRGVGVIDRFSENQFGDLSRGIVDYRRIRKTECDGYLFDSPAEALRYGELKLLEKSGLVKILTLQPKVHMTDARILYKPDFLVLDKTTGQEVYEEVKGFESAIWRLKRRLWIVYGPGPLRVFKGSAKTGLTLFETINPTKAI